MQVREDEARHRSSGRNRIPEGQFAESAIQLRELAGRASQGHCFGRFRSREEIGVEPREHQPVGDVVVVLDLDPDRLDQLVGERRAVYGRALVGRQCRRGNSDLTLRPRLGARDVGSMAARVLCGGRRAAEHLDNDQRDDDDSCNSRTHGSAPLPRPPLMTRTVSVMLTTARSILQKCPSAPHGTAIRDTVPPPGAVSVYGVRL